ncbi:uncharacterized protein LOC125042088 [Penaeus chinensis]|uniref:uncharacterized protein LOC125042088 n=1 Tax=Penaeus chinensis TaxID=139456 RepID=UPI001FB711CD|nr:uncharacterized protein LOC125042088 [Penaeus chinensis]
MALYARRLMLVAALFVVSYGQIARRFREGNRFFYVISDFALMDPADYTTSTTQSSCEYGRGRDLESSCERTLGMSYMKPLERSCEKTPECRKTLGRCLCRRRCQLLPNCSSVSILPPAGGGAAGVECRISSKPADLSEVSARPRLSKYRGALHFLATVEQEWKPPEADGLIYTLDPRPSTWAATVNICKAGEGAVATTWLQFNILGKYLETLEAGTGMIVELCQYCFQGDQRPITWGYVNRIPYSDTELNMSLVVDPNPGSFAAYHMDKIGSEYKFIGTDATDTHPTLCQDNDLNLEL